MASNLPVKAGFWYCRQAGDNSISTSEAPIYFTHLFCAYADISGTDYKVTIPVKYQGTFANFTEGAKKGNSSIKTIFSIGGVDSDPQTFVSIIINEGKRDAFIQSSIQQARDNNFDGLHLSWPCWKYQPTHNDMTYLGTFFSKWREAVDEEASAKNKEPLLLTATVSHRPHISDSNSSDPVRYPANDIDTKLNWIIVRAYDIYNARSSPGKTAPPAALHNPRQNKSFESADTGISEWVSAVSRNKLVIGLPFVGYEWLLEDAAKHDFFDPAKGSGNENRDGYISYRDIKTKSNFTHEFKTDYVTDYSYGGNNWIGYDGTESITKKIEYFKQNELLGYFAWHVCADDDHWTLSRTAFEKMG